MRPGQPYLPPFLPLSEARARLGHWLSKAETHDGWIPIMKHRRIIGGLIGPRDLKALERASQPDITWNEYQLWQRRARIEMLNAALKRAAVEKMEE